MARKPKTPKPPKPPKDRYKYGIAEWFGHPFALMTVEQRQHYATELALPKRERPRHLCPFQSYGERQVYCSKINDGAVCSTRLYKLVGATREIEIVPSPRGSIRTLCPARFMENGTIFQWIGEVILNHPSPVVVNQVSYLQRPLTDSQTPESEADFKDVGRIDHVLMNPDTKDWCALEIQAVYFSGGAMGAEFAAIRQSTSPTIPFPVGSRRPDDRSSGPKRLLPQLQTKVPSLRRWGKKMAVVIDEGFFASLGPMRNVPHVSNADIIWFVVRFDESTGRPVLAQGPIHRTRLEDAIDGLTGGEPVSKEEFERRIEEKLAVLP